jgi:hypothetical protein
MLCIETAMSKRIKGFEGSEYCMLIPLMIKRIISMAFSACHNLTHTGYKYNFSDIIFYVLGF